MSETLVHRDRDCKIHRDRLVFDRALVRAWNFTTDPDEGEFLVTTSAPCGCIFADVDDDVDPYVKNPSRHSG